jgi:hypothetical protein
VRILVTGGRVHSAPRSATAAARPATSLSSSTSRLPGKESSLIAATYAMA